jgi:hypothetical protein
MQQLEDETHQGENVRESGKLNDLETSGKHFKAALDLTPEGHPDRANQCITKSGGGGIQKWISEVRGPQHP